MSSGSRLLTIDGVMVFAATRPSDRAELGERVTQWIRTSPVAVADIAVVQSSDATHHCVTIVVFYCWKRR